MIDLNHTFLSNENPMTCPQCGARSEIIKDLSHLSRQMWVHRCYNCKFEFVEEYDSEIIFESDINEEEK